MDQQRNISPPQLPLKFLRWFCQPDLLEDVEGDVSELFYLRAEEGAKKAGILIYLDVLLLFRPGIIKSLRIVNQTNSTTMFKYHLKTAFRHAMNKKGYTLINLLGLSIGIASCILILLWVNDEVQKNQFHAKADRTFQVWRNMHQASGEVNTTPGIPQPLELVLENEYPEVDEVTLLSWSMERLFRNNKYSSYRSGRYASPEFFSIFSFPIIHGNPKTVLQDANTIVISESMAIQYYKSPELAINQLIKVDDQQELKIVGVFQDIANNSSVHFDWIMRAQDYIDQNDWVESWYNGGFGIFLTLNDPKDFTVVQERVRYEIIEHIDNSADERIYLQNLSEIHLYSNFENGRPAGGRILYVRILLSMAIFILLIACINFTNLSIARSGRRAQEIGIRKVIGANKRSLINQFLTESYLISSLAVIIAIILVLIILPYFNHIVDKTLVLDFTDQRIWMGLIGITLFSGFLSGAYPALLQSSFKLISSIRGTFKLKSSGSFLRNGMVVFQFVISIIMIVSTIIFTQQMDFIMNKNLGLDKENVLYLELDGELANSKEAYKNSLLQISEVSGVTYTSGNPLDYGRSTGSAEWDGKDPDAVVEINVLNADEDLVDAMDMQIVEGRYFSTEFGTDSSNYVINEVTAKIMGFDSPVGQNLSIWGMKGKVIGVVRNFHMGSMYENIQPLIIRYDPSSTFVAFIRVQNDIPKAISSIEDITKELNPAFPFRYEFMDESYEAEYRGEMSIKTLAIIFSVVSIIISCLGLLGLSSYSADQRSKEIGIRKVHGAGIVQLILMLSKNYTRLILMAFILATPITWYLISQWLNDFAFRIELNPIVFIAAGVLAFIIGAVTVGLKSYQAASSNPIRTLKVD